MLALTQVLIGIFVNTRWVRMFPPPGSRIESQLLHLFVLSTLSPPLIRVKVSSSLLLAAPVCVSFIQDGGSSKEEHASQPFHVVSGVS